MLIRSQRLTALLVIAACIPLLSGCNTGTTRPNWGNPGEIKNQRYQAVRFDPYPEPDVGPDMDSRPREYAQPLSESARSRWTLGR